MKPATKRALARQREKWLQIDGNRYGIAALLSAGLAVAGPIASEIVDALLKDSGVLRASLLWAGVVGALFTWLFKNAQRDEGRTQQQADIDELLDVFDDTLVRLPEVASADPDELLSRIYVEQVVSALRRRLEPEGPTKFVRVCVYRRDQQELEGARDGSEKDRAADGVTRDSETRFVRYVFSLGRRTDRPRRYFSDAEPPGSDFIPVLIERGRHAASKPGDFEGGDRRYASGEPAKYSSFVNIALVDASGDVFAMLTCDASEADFFDERREVLIRAFSRLVGVALTEGATRPEVSRPPGLDSLSEEERP